MVDTSALLTGTADPYQIVSDLLGVSLATAIIILAVISIWSLVWKGFALWKSGRKTKIIWFIGLLIVNTLGLFEIFYMFIFSKIKDARQFKSLHDGLLFISVIFALLGIWNIIFLVPILFFWGLFTLSLLQESVDRKEWWWLVFGILLAPLVPIIYYFLKVRVNKPKIKKKK